jgi:hypothetical protein
LTETDVCLDLFIHWLNLAYPEQKGHFRIIGAGSGVDRAQDTHVSVAVEVRPLVSPTENEGWLSVRRHLEERLATQVPAPIAVWVPAGAELPGSEPAASDFVDRVRGAALKLGPRERSYVALPIILYLRKNSESGGVVSVTGGLNPYWARFTDRVRGTYDLDSTRLHRLPESEEHLERLIETIVERASTLNVGRVAEIETFDAWTVQSLSEGPRRSREGEVAIIGRPPVELAEMGLAVRRNFRRILSEAAPALRASQADVRALVVLGFFARIDQEGVTTALRGYDPTLYSGIDFVCLAADGVIKPLIQAPASRLARAG